MHFLKSAWFGGITSGRMRWHVEDALIHAAMRTDAMVETGDLDGYAVWRRILRAVEELQGTTPKSGEAVH